jgi:hypothetical protein
MRKIVIICLSVVVLLSSCFHHRNNIDVTLTEDERKYEMNAAYHPNQTARVQRFIQSQLQPATIFKNTNSDVDVNAVLSDDTKLYIKSNKGSLQIKLNKEDNSEASYYRIKKMCEDVKDLIAH